MKEKYSLNDFDILAKIGKGAQGHVYLVKLKPDVASHLPDGKELAMKVMSKEFEVEYKHFWEERNILG